MIGVLLIIVGLMPFVVGAVWAWKNDRALFNAFAVVMTFIAAVVVIVVGISMLITGAS
ncbi:hypothetical protein SEA_JAMIE19_37 [Mycobacterium phage Jamie19]|uniref:Uncharacterized protein n=4 Tax=Charlievirus TaxID=1623280 RepID=A0A142K834_9CAUD|nr:membrane protein [Mycobacterium phage Phrann]YP_009304944.1 membrane protein [Mycobacterium phage Panchino]YP_010052109.1 membrane protein [Mycobacterium phage Andies]YP_010052380.1 membrane protein [Mycobacterium phage Jamie19]QBI98048.1 hypothetical protein SEA_SPONGEBOB_37 [Mycobacterium phage SpongeBob]QNN98139.1 hypothetical protein SEA_SNEKMAGGEDON_37 [Mycobacterium phage Snekmaggedon]WAA19758.1 hypothetical protein SEA_SHWETA_37 [Mycobacterium phage Shweta]AMS02054.1 hypothetical p